MNGTTTKQDIEKLLIEFGENRGLKSTFCPSEIARALKPESWRDYMNAVREVADILVKKGQLVVMQKGVIISELPSVAKGPIRLRKK